MYTWNILQFYIPNKAETKEKSIVPGVGLPGFIWQVFHITSQRILDGLFKQSIPQHLYL